MIAIIGSPEVWGIIPSFLDVNDPRPAQEQINERYISGWNPAPEGMKLEFLQMVLTYPGDPPFKCLGMMMFRDELLMMFQSEFVAIVQKDRSYKIARLD